MRSEADGQVDDELARIAEPLAGARPEHATGRVIDAKTDARPCSGGLMLGGYEPDPPDCRFTVDESDDVPGLYCQDEVILH